MLKAHNESLDIDYMRKMAEADHESSLEKLKEWLSEVKLGFREPGLRSRFFNGAPEWI